MDAVREAMRSSASLVKKGLRPKALPLLIGQYGRSSASLVKKGLKRSTAPWRESGRARLTERPHEGGGKQACVTGVAPASAVRHFRYGDVRSTDRGEGCLSLTDAASSGGAVAEARRTGARNATSAPPSLRWRRIVLVGEGLGARPESACGLEWRLLGLLTLFLEPPVGWIADAAGARVVVLVVDEHGP